MEQRKIVAVTAFGILACLPWAAFADGQEECRQDLQCWAEKHHISAEIKCERPIERLARFSTRWTDRFLERRFSVYAWHDKATGAISYFGDMVEFQTPGGAWQPIIYKCDFDPETDTVIGVVGEPGRL